MPQIGLIGLGTMGNALARNFASKNISTAVFNRTAIKTEGFIKSYGNENLVPFYQLDDFVSSLALPRKIILMVNAGQAVDQTIEHLIPLLDSGDIIIDCGNSFWKDTLKRQLELEAKNIHFVGCGVSGGEVGALYGPSIMPGGDSEIVNELLPLLQTVAAKDFTGEACVTNTGLAGAGHFVKMVHNGIEYALMQGIAEIYDILRHSGYNNQDLVTVFDKLNHGEPKSFLLDITVDIFKTADNLDSGYLIDKISPVAGAKGTGKWTVEAAMDLGISIPNISGALFARILSAKTHNFKVSHAFESHTLSQKREVEHAVLFDCLKAIFYTSYLQGIDLILAANKEFNWSINILEVLRIWQGGCIIRSNMLTEFSTDFKTDSNDFSSKLKVQQQALEVMLGYLSTQSFSLPLLSVFNSALDYCRALTTQNLPTNLIQAQRDYFGAHTYQRVDREGVFTGGWN